MIEMNKPTKNEKNKDKKLADAKPKSGMLGKLILPVVLGITSFSTVYFLPRAEAPIAETKTLATSDPAHDKTGDGSVPIETSFINLEPFMVSLKGRSHILRISITLEAPQESADLIDPKNPKLRDAFMGYLSALGMEQVEDAAFLVRLRAQLTRRAKFVLGPTNVQNVLITDFMVR